MPQERAWLRDGGPHQGQWQPVVRVTTQQEVLGRNTDQQATSSKRRSGKVKEGGDTVHVSCPRPRVLPRRSILTERCAHHQEGSRVRTAGQRQPGNHLISVTPETGSPAAGRSSWAPSPAVLHPGAPPSKVSSLVGTCLPGPVASECETRARSRALEGVPHSY